MSRTVIVGDIHGMLPELRLLLERVELGRGDQLVLVGDLVDKGPDSPGVVRQLRELREAGHDVVLVLGNHEDKHARYRLARAKAPSGQAIQMTGVEDLAAITEALSPEDIAFLETAVLLHKLPEHGALVVHGGIPPLLQTLDEADKGMRGQLLRLRMVRRVPLVRLTVEYTYDHDVGDAPDPSFTSRTIVKKVVRPAGSFVPLGEEAPGDPFWADGYDGRFGHVYFGHSPFLQASEPVRFPHATALDLGAVHGNRLAAAVLEPGREPRFVTVPASGTYAAALWEE